jgi:hypothetical protein
MFSFQRSYPDRDFDWKGWKNAMQEVRLTLDAQAKPLDCAGVTGNWTEQGPANIGARCNTLAVKPDDENTVLAGFAGGGIFKTTDGGVNWRPVFDDHLELCIGDITFDPVNPNVVYAGTGDPNLPSIVFNGDGVYKSVDAGETWNYLGLGEQGIVSKILVHPTIPKILFAATMGNPYVRDEERGIFKSINGGLTWQKVLFVSNQAGASDLVQSPVNPNILYASFWDRIRNNTESIIYGPNAKVYKSEDGGDTWQQLTNGLPNGTQGRTGLAISQQNPDKLYVLYVDSLSTTGSMYKTTNGGTSFTPVNISSLEDACSDFGWYFGKVRVNPTNDEDLYFLAILLYRKQAGSSSWISAGGGHADSHDLVFTPSGRRYWANDGGVYRNDVGQMTWTKCKNLPVTQFYRTTFNPHQPNIYWGGTQDNGIQKGVGGASINNWSTVFAADGFQSAFDPNDPLTFWVEIQNGTIHKTTNGGVSWQFGTSALGTTDRCSWDAPFFRSKFGDTKLFSATYRVYVSSGSGWGAISPDLTDGIIYTPRFHTVTALHESPVLPEKLMAGTSDGNVWRREPTSNWVNITGNLPDRFVTSVQLSPTLSNRLFVTHSGYRSDEQIPHVHRSDNNGSSWVDISGDLPQMPINDIFILPQHADSVLFVAADAGVYYSLNRGTNWSRLGGNMPVIPVFDLEINPVRKELIAATFARGIWTFPLDSIFAQAPNIQVFLNGTIKTETGIGVNAVQVGNSTTNQNGDFQAAVPGCSDYQLAPYRNDNPLNGVTTYDLVLMSKHILGIEALGSPYKMIAADANLSNSITTFDIVALRKLILGIDSTIVGNTSWRFIPANHTFSNPGNPFLSPFPQTLEGDLQISSIGNQNFIAVKVGDVNHTVVPNVVGPASERTTGTWQASLPDITFEANETFSVVFGGDMTDIAALQFSLHCNPEYLELHDIEPLAEGVSSQDFGWQHQAMGWFSAALTPAQSAAKHANTPLFRLYLTAKKAGQLREVVQLGAFPTPALVFRSNGAALTPVLWSQPVAMQVHLSPNPFGNEGVTLQVEPTASSDTDLIWEVLDVSGKVLYRHNLKGLQQLHLPVGTFPGSGVYYWRIAGTTLAGKLVLTR